MAVQVRSASAAGHNSPSVDVTVPAGVVDGDLLVALVFSSDSASAMSAPPGWQWPFMEDTGTPVFFAGYRTASSEPASYTFTHNGDWFIMVTVVAMTGADNSAPIDVADAQGQDGDDIVAPSISTTVSDAMLLCFWAGYQAFGTAPPEAPPDMTELASAQMANQDYFSAAAKRLLGTPGSTGDRIATFGADTNGGGLSVAIKPAADSSAPVALTGSPVTVSLTAPIGTVTAGTRVSATVTAPAVAATVTAPAGSVTAGTKIPASVTAPAVTATVSTPAGTVSAGTAVSVTTSAPPVSVTVTTPPGGVAAGTTIAASITAPPVGLAVDTPAGDVSAGTKIPMTVTADPVVTVTVSTPAGTVRAGRSIDLGTVDIDAQIAVAPHPRASLTVDTLNLALAVDTLALALTVDTLNTRPTVDTLDCVFLVANDRHDATIEVPTLDASIDVLN